MGGGDFRSAECVELLKQADIVVTNPLHPDFGQHPFADELSEAYDEMERLQVEAKNSEQSIRSETREALEAKVAPVVESLAVRIENIAASLESD